MVKTDTTSIGRLLFIFQNLVSSTIIFQQLVRKKKIFLRVLENSLQLLTYMHDASVPKVCHHSLKGNTIFQFPFSLEKTLV